MSRTRLQQGLRATFVGLSVNAVLAVTKLVAGLLGHSHALVADSVAAAAAGAAKDESAAAATAGAEGSGSSEYVPGTGLFLAMPAKVQAISPRTVIRLSFAFMLLD